MGQIEKVNKYIVSFYINNIEDLQYDALQKESVEYALGTILSEVEKILILIVLYTCIGKIVPFIAIFLVICPLRMLTGGIHMNSFITCLVVSGLYFTFIIYVSECVKVGKITYVTTILLVMAIAPVQTKNHLTSIKREYWKQKMGAIGIIVAVYALFELVMTQMAMYIQLGLCVYQVELIIAKIINEGRLRT
jgi:accessory gene regulator B